MEVRDPVHGLIEYDDLEEQVINSRAFQRLRNIRQLAMANLVYPGAVHTRFDHSLGVMHVAGQIARKLTHLYPGMLDDREEANIRVAGLLHDVGHGPFSHVSELPLAQLSSEYVSQTKVAPEALHEIVTLDVIRHDEELRRILGDRIEAVARMLDVRSSRRPTVAQSIISGPLDADKLDYLLRDSYFCGVKYGVYDMERVLDGLRVISSESGEHFVGVSEESVPAFEQHLMARYQMTTQVYRHRIRRCTDCLLARAILLAAQDGAEEIATLYAYRGSDLAFVTRWISYDDTKLLDAISTSCRGKSAANLVEGLIWRRLPLRVCELRLSEVGVFQEEKLTRSEARRRLEGRLANRLGVDPTMVVVDLVQSRPPRPSSSEPGIDPGTILVDREGGRPEKFHEASEIFRLDPLGKTGKLVIHAPFQSASHSARREEREELCRQVRTVLQEQAREA